MHVRARAVDIINTHVILHTSYSHFVYDEVYRYLRPVQHTFSVKKKPPVHVKMTWHAIRLINILLYYIVVLSI